MHNKSEVMQCKCSGSTLMADNVVGAKKHQHFGLLLKNAHFALIIKNLEYLNLILCGFIDKIQAQQA